MQKARRHPTKGLRPIVGTRFQALFHPPARGAFHLSLTVLIAIGISLVFSLSAWSRIIQTGFLVSRPTQDTALLICSYVYGGLTLYAAPFHTTSTSSIPKLSPSYNPADAETSAVWAPPFSLAATPGITFVFFSSAYLDVSVQRVCRLSPRRVTPFGHPSVIAVMCTSAGLFAACRVLLRRRDPRHPPCALVFFLNCRAIFQWPALVSSRCPHPLFLTDASSVSLTVNVLFIRWRITDSNR